MSERDKTNEAGQGRAPEPAPQAAAGRGLLSWLKDNTVGNWHWGTELKAFWRQGVKELRALFDPSTSGSIAQGDEYGSVFAGTTPGEVYLQRRQDNAHSQADNVHGKPNNLVQEVMAHVGPMPQAPAREIDQGR